MDRRPTSWNKYENFGENGTLSAVSRACLQNYGYMVKAKLKKF